MFSVLTVSMIDEKILISYDIHEYIIEHNILLFPHFSTQFFKLLKF